MKFEEFSKRAHLCPDQELKERLKIPKDNRPVFLSASPGNCLLMLEQLGYDYTEEEINRLSKPLGNKNEMSISVRNGSCYTTICSIDNSRRQFDNSKFRTTYVLHPYKPEKEISRERLIANTMEEIGRLSISRNFSFCFQNTIEPVYWPDKDEQEMCR